MQPPETSELCSPKSCDRLTVAWIEHLEASGSLRKGPLPLSVTHNALLRLKSPYVPPAYAIVNDAHPRKRPAPRSWGTKVCARPSGQLPVPCARLHTSSESLCRGLEPLSLLYTVAAAASCAFHPSLPIFFLSLLHGP